MSKRSNFYQAIVVAQLLSCGISFAGSTSTTVAVSATVSQGCSVSTISALAFGSYDPIGANATAALNATGQLSVACSKGASGLTIGMDNGSHALGIQRQMQGTLVTDILRYNLFQPPSTIAGVACSFPGTTGWTATGPGLLTLSTAPSKVIRLYNVCGTIPGGQDAMTGVYSDTVIATLNF
jgi:spore coat protein U-like protein